MKLLIIISFLVFFTNCNQKEKDLSIKSKYYSTLSEIEKDFFKEKLATKNLYDNTPAKKYKIPKDQIDYSTWTSTKYKSGELVKSINSSRIFNYNKNNSITIINKKKYDAIVNIIQINEKNSRCFLGYFLKSGEKFTLEGIPNGRYKIHGALGNDWKEKQINSNSLIGSFSKNIHHFRNNKTLTFNGNVEHTISISEALIGEFNKDYFDENTVIEDENGNTISSKRFVELLNKNKKLKPQKVISNGRIECISITQ